MKTTGTLALVVLIAASVVALYGAQAQPGIKRTDLQRQDLSAPGREVIQVLVEFAPGAVFPKHSHPGEEIVYVVEGSLEYEVEGKPPVTLEAGDFLFIPAGAIHAVRNVGRGDGAELATYVVEKGNRSSHRSSKRLEVGESRSERDRAHQHSKSDRLGRVRPHHNQCNFLNRIYKPRHIDSITPTTMAYP